MDPDEALRVALELAKKVTRGEVGDLDAFDVAHEMAEAILALDEWMEKGGFAPARWSKHQEHPHG